MFENDNFIAFLTALKTQLTSQPYDNRKIYMIAVIN